MNVEALLQCSGSAFFIGNYFAIPYEKLNGFFAYLEERETGWKKNNLNDEKK